jgi:hypothetical protein
MIRRGLLALFAAGLLWGCNAAAPEPELLRPGERVAFKLADNVKLVAGNSVQLAVAFEATDENGNVRDLPCDHGKLVGARRVLARVQFYGEDESRMDYQDVFLTNH